MHTRLSTDAIYDTEKLLNNSVKHALGVSPNTLLFGDAIPTEQSLMPEIYRILTSTTIGLCGQVNGSAIPFDCSRCDVSATDQR